MGWPEIAQPKNRSHGGGALRLPSTPRQGPNGRSEALRCCRYCPTGRQGSKGDMGSGAWGSGAAGGIGSGAGAIGFGAAALRGAAFFFGAAFFGFAFAFLAGFFALAADFRAATFLRAPLAAALPRAVFRLAFLLVALAMLCLLLGSPQATSRRVAEIAL